MGKNQDSEALVFYKGNPQKGDKTCWIMHEFKVTGPVQANRRNSMYDNEDTSMRVSIMLLTPNCSLGLIIFKGLICTVNVKTLFLIN